MIVPVLPHGRWRVQQSGTVQSNRSAVTLDGWASHASVSGGGGVAMCSAF